MEFIVILPLVFLVVFVAAGTLVSLSAKRRAGPLPPSDRRGNRPPVESDDHR